MITLAVILSAVTYRIARFIVLDKLIDGPRDKMHGWLLKTGRLQLLRLKLSELLGCPQCITIWISAAVTAVTAHYVDVPLPIWVWLSVATGSIVIWRYTDADE